MSKHWKPYPIPEGAEIEFCDEVPAPGPELYVKRLKGSESLSCLILATGIRGAKCHWTNGHTIPHFTNPSLCEGCKQKIGIDWKGFLHVYATELNAQIFLELTPFSARAVMTLFPQPESMRGNWIKVTRTKAANGRMRVQPQSHMHPPKNLPEEKNPMTSVLRMWGILDETPQFDMDPADVSDPMTETAF